MQVITQLDEHGHKLEPYEEAVVEVPEGEQPAVDSVQPNDIADLLVVSSRRGCISCPH